MKTLIVALFALVSLASVAQAQDATPAWNDVLRTCSEEYRARPDKATNKGRDVWTTFLNECKTRKGFVPKRDRNRGEFVRVPDKAN